MPSSGQRARHGWMALPLVFLAIGTRPAAGEGEAEALSARFRQAAKRVLPAVVTVRSLESPVLFRPPMPFEPDGPGLFQRREGSGSGVVIDAAKGYVLTNDHVVSHGGRVVVVLHDGREREVTEIRRDPKSDLALLSIDPKGKDALTQADWGDSEALDTGDWVLAVGQPFGLSNTVTAGIVSGKGRGIGMSMYEDLIQTDAAINPGNSGGPLVNLKGEVVGINAAIKTLGGGYEGVGFAVPSARAQRVARELAEQGRVRRAYLGVNIGAVEPAQAERVGQAGAVAIIGVVPDSPAAEAGLRRGDVIVSLQGKPVQGPGPLQAAIEIAPVDAPLTLTIDREGERKEIQITPKAQPETFGLPDRGPGFGPRPRPSRPRPRTLDPPALPEPPRDGGDRP